ncbi:hypothetical protein EJB05_01103, partial [Eragrostis curvula]
MATTGTASLSAAARRICASTTASRIVPRVVTASHKLTIDGCTTSKLIINKRTWMSPTFEAAGSSWRIAYGPYGHKPYRIGQPIDPSPTDKDDDYLSLYLQLDPAKVSRSDQVEMAKFKFSLLDESGNPVPEFTRATTEFSCFGGDGKHQGFCDFVRWKDLEESGCLKDDCFAVRCDITALTDGGGEGDAPAVVVPPSDLHHHLTDLLWKKKEGKDVTIAVAGGETFDAHGWLLAARSPVFEAELLAAAKEKVPGGGIRRHVEVQGVDPNVFKAMLHFMYTDALPAPETEGTDAAAMAGGLLAAAHRYKLERLKLMCEEMLLKRVDVDTVAATLAVAEQHGCRALKAACVEFITRPGNLKAVMETQGFQKMKDTCPGVVMEIVMKQLA